LFKGCRAADETLHVIAGEGQMFLPWTFAKPDTHQQTNITMDNCRFVDYLPMKNADLHCEVSLPESIWQFYLSIIQMRIIYDNTRIAPHSYVNSEETNNMGLTGFGGAILIPESQGSQEPQIFGWFDETYEVSQDKWSSVPRVLNFHPCGC